MAHKLDNYLRMYRRRTGLWQEEVALLLGSEHDALVGRHESGAHVPDLATALAYEAIFGVPVRDLFAGILQSVEHDVTKRARRLARTFSAAVPRPLSSRALELLNPVRDSLRVRQDVMPSERNRLRRVLAIDPTWRCIGFAVLEGPDRLVDWGMRRCEGDIEASTLQRIKDLWSQYAPDLLVLEDVRKSASRRRPRVRTLITNVAESATKDGISVRMIDPRRMRAAMLPARTKDEIARALADRFPELARHLPPPRRGNGASEDERLAIFDAVALALAAVSKKQPIERAAQRGSSSGRRVSALNPDETAPLTMSLR